MISSERDQAADICLTTGSLWLQANSALALGVSISRDASVRAAGGYLVQVRPSDRA